MQSKKQLLSSTNLYLIASITDYKNRFVLYRKLNSALKSGVKILQLRCKNISDYHFLKLAKKIKGLAKKHKALLIINDRVDIALFCEADGVHLGRDDLSVVCARKILGKTKIIGKSTHSLKQALNARAEMADYIGFGPIFKTKTKPGLDPIGTDSIKLLAKRIKIPFFVLGGINTENIKKVIAEGAARIAVSDAILSKANIKSAVKNFQKFIHLCSIK